MRPHSSLRLFASCLVIALLLLGTGCGADVSSAPVSADTRAVTFSSRAPADVEAVMSLCTRLTLVGGQTELLGRRDLLSGCLGPDGQVDMDTIVRAAPTTTDALRWMAVAGVLADVAEPFAAPLPTTLPARSFPAQTISPFIWILPLVDGALESSGVPPLAREPILEAVVQLVQSATCRLTGSVTPTFRRAPLEDLRVSFSRAGGDAHVRLSAGIDPDRTVATYRLSAAFTCNGSTANLVHDVLQMIVPGRSHAVRIDDGGIVVRVFPEPAGRELEGVTDVSVNIAALDVTPPVSWVDPAAWRALLDQAGVDERSVEEEIEPRLADALEELGPQIAAALTDRLEVLRSERITAVAAEGSAPRDLVVTIRNTGCIRTVTGQLICLPPRF